MPPGAGTSASGSPLVASLAQWVWLLEFKATRSALEASTLPTADLASALSTCFDQVHLARPDVASLDAAAQSARDDGWEPASAAVACLAEVALGDDSLDCIAVHDLFRSRAGSAVDVAAELAAAVRLLRPGGWLSLCTPLRQVIPWRGRRAGARRRGGVETLLRRAGFREVRCMFAEPSLERPLLLIPDSRSAVAMIEGREIRSTTKRLVRRALSAGPLRGDLFAACFLFARK